ncbi:HAD family hydrolase [Aliidiomarina maris]|uniref:HAD superfamily hydrolase (TIGR01509 family)/HAD superfamily hydrolase (TIGR01549 family) n=1 Tax=Aliidiomarina maris TaxID=531312 RepID=A0A327WZU3_9GAMM|nr:HAD-IA family hydrolase [Aliidiomarina maris]RAJ99041.1 HAD superfamily hydrolase (TIGR01509 family)/HAD superfamily hydrolase (TIGR01549 family) [Aliidiomarina maris]
MQHIKGIIFDLDGTLVSSSLDFNAIRRDIGCPPQQDILDYLAALPANEREQAQALVFQHELDDAHSSDWMPNAQSFIHQCALAKIPMAIVTRNSAQPTHIKVTRNGIPISHVVTREQSKPKPDPSALLAIAQQFDLPSDAIMMVGDYKYDLQAGRNAGMATCLINYQQLPDYVHLADYRFEHFGLLSDAMFNASTARF